MHHRQAQILEVVGGVVGVLRLANLEPGRRLNRSLHLSRRRLRCVEELNALLQKVRTALGSVVVELPPYGPLPGLHVVLFERWCLRHHFQDRLPCHRRVLCPLREALHVLGLPPRHDLLRFLLHLRKLFGRGAVRRLRHVGHGLDWFDPGHDAERYGLVGLAPLFVRVIELAANVNAAREALCVRVHELTEGEAAIPPRHRILRHVVGPGEFDILVESPLVLPPFVRHKREVEDRYAGVLALADLLVSDGGPLLVVVDQQERFGRQWARHCVGVSVEVGVGALVGELCRKARLRGHQQQRANETYDARPLGTEWREQGVHTDAARECDQEERLLPEARVDPEEQRIVQRQVRQRVEDDKVEDQGDDQEQAQRLGLRQRRRLGLLLGLAALATIRALALALCTLHQTGHGRHHEQACADQR
mmetsp:Transcript_72656/g.206891  ORF Transcript_72656/g.206891 Transcript_72656/m.206891 type:complete len:420 (+) Transcript_72656:421-1680(+)